MAKLILNATLILDFSRVDYIMLIKGWVKYGMFIKIESGLKRFFCNYFFLT